MAKVEHVVANGALIPSLGFGTYGMRRSEMLRIINYRPSMFAPSVKESLHRLRTDYIDLLLLHWPSAVVPLSDQLGEMSHLVGRDASERDVRYSLLRYGRGECARSSRQPRC